MVAEYETIQERTISGKGVLKVPADKDKNRAYTLFASVIRKPKQEYKNLHYNPPLSKYGFLSFLRKDYVLFTATLDFERQAYDGINDIAGQTLIALKCVNNAVLQSIFNLSVALAETPGGLGLTPINFDNVIKEYTNLRLAWDECRLVCYADTAISLRLVRLKYDTCNPDFDDDKPLPPPPPPPPPVLPGTPLTNISLPYTPDYPQTQGDEGNTVPNPIDKLPPLPPAPIGTASVVTVQFAVISSTGVVGSPQGVAVNVRSPYYVMIDFYQSINVYTKNTSGVYVASPIYGRSTKATYKAIKIINIFDSKGYDVDVRYAS